MTPKAGSRLCIDRVIPLEHKEEAARFAVEQSLRNRPEIVLRLGVSMHPMKMALLTGKTWPNLKHLRVKFLDGSPTQKAKVMAHAQEWSKFAAVTFDLVSRGNAEVRVSFVADSGSWSAIGADCLVTKYFPKDEPTMNFGWLRDDTDDVEYRRVVVHEFGHALGAIHEHQNPKGGIKWNLPAVYRYFSGPPNNWSKDEIDYNIVQKYSLDQLNASKFDRKSIMLYAFPPELMVGGKGTPNNTDLSAGDKKFIGKMYPKR